VRYLFGPGRSNEHSEQRAVALATSLDSTSTGTVLDARQVALLGQEMDAMRVKLGLPAKGAVRRVKVAAGVDEDATRLPGMSEAREKFRHGPGHVWHMSLSNPVGDRPLTDTEWGAIARKAMDQVGFTEATGKAPVRWVAVRHGVSLAGNEHIHVAATIYRDDGSKATVFRDYRKMSAFAADVEREYALAIVGGRATQGGPGVTRAELERARRDGRPEAVRTSLARLVSEARTSSASETEFVKRLRAAGVAVRPRWAEGGTNVVTGYSVGLKREGQESTVWFGGSRLGGDLSLPQLRQFWEATPEETAAATGVWRSPGRDAHRLRPVSPDEWRRATKILDAAYDRLTELSPHAPEWPMVAREMSGLYAAWSRRLEGASPGPLARAADLLSQASQVHPDVALTARPNMKGYRAVAIVAAQGQIGPENRGTGWAMLLVALHRHLQLVAEVEAARGQHRLASQLSSASRELQKAPPRGPRTTPLRRPPTRQRQQVSVQARFADQASTHRGPQSDMDR
jgi:hypothetical protein